MKQVFLMVFRLSLGSFACLFILSAPPIHAQEDPPIGRHYANPIDLLPPESEQSFNMSQPEVLDINGDGRDDVAVSRLDDNMNDPAPLYIWTSNEAGSMENSTPALIEGAVPIENSGYRQIIPADFNGDGRLDLFLESHGPEPDCGPDLPDCWPGGQNSLLLSDNDGKLTNVTTTHLPQYMDFSHGSSVADFDGDGDVDIWVNTVGGNSISYPGFAYLMHNDGEGHFTVVADLFNEESEESDGIPVVGRSPILPEGTYRQGLWSIAIDVEGDGDMDLQLTRSFQADYSVEPGEFTYVNRLLVNDGTGRFDQLPGDSWPSLGCSVSPDQPDPEACKYDELPLTQHALVYDLNLDGLDDMLLHQTPNADWSGAFIQILISNGDGTFRDESVERYPDGFDIEPQLHDLDGDGHKDLFSHANDKNDIRINDGEGYFRRLAEDWVVTPDWNWVVLDVDGDGGTDFLNNTYLGFFLSKMNLPYGAVLDGTSEDDRLIGGAHDNVYRGLAGNDVLDGGLGDDDLDGGEGDDELIGGKGDEWLKPGPGTNTVDGGPGRDLVEYALAMDEVEILLDETTFISNGDDSVNDEIKNAEYALFTDAATPLPTKQQSAIGSLNGVAGLWYDPDLDGEGFNVITTPSGTVIFFYGFNANSERVWLVSETLPDGFDFEQVVDVQMYEGTGGTFDQPADPVDGLLEWGRLKMLFDACNTARFALHGSDGVKTTYQIKLAGITNADCQVQTLSAPSGLAGLWYDPILDGEGYNVIITETATVVLFYGYGADGQGLWLLSEAMAGAPVIGETVTLQMFVSTDGTFDEPLASSEVLKDWGELEVTFNSCGAAHALLAGTDGEKTSNLTKLAGIDQSTCP